MMGSRLKPITSGKFTGRADRPRADSLQRFNRDLGGLAFKSGPDPDEFEKFPRRCALTAKGGFDPFADYRKDVNRRRFLRVIASSHCHVIESIRQKV